MKKIGISIFTIFIACQQLTAQATHFISVGPELGIPRQTSMSQSKLGFGGSLDYQFKFFASPIAIQLHVGHTRFTSLYYSDQKIRFLPVRVGVAGFIYGDKVFGFADVGISRYSSSVTQTSQTGFSFGAGIAYRYIFINGQFIQISGYYNLHNFKNEQLEQDFNYNWINLRVAYGLSWGKGKKKTR